MLRMTRRHAVLAAGLTGALGAGMIGFAAPALAAAEDAVGTWNDPSTQAVMQIYPCDGGSCIKIVKPGTAQQKDDYNPDQSLKGRSLAGVVVMQSGVKDGAERWKGKLYNPEDGKTYTGSLEVESKDHVKLQGCVLGGLICKSREWNRVQ